MIPDYQPIFDFMEETLCIDVSLIRNSTDENNCWFKGYAAVLTIEELMKLYQKGVYKGEETIRTSNA